MAARDVRAGGAYVEFSLRRKDLERSLREVGSRLRKFGGQVRQIGAALTAAGAAIEAPFAASLAIFQKYGDALDKTSRRTGVAVESLSELRFAAEQSGSNLETFEKGLKTAQRSIYDLGRGLSTQTDAFAELGLTFKDLDGLSPEDQFTLIADRVSQIEDPSKRAALSMVLLGRAGQQLVPLLAGGEKSIADLRKQARDLGLTIDTDAAQSAAAFGDAINALKSQIRVVAFNIGAALAPKLQELIEKVQPIVRGVIEWAKANGSLIRTVATVGAAVTAAGLTFVALGTAIGVVGFAITSFAAVVSAVLSPLGLLAAAVVGLGVAFFKFTDAGGEAVDFLRGKFSTLIDSVKESVKGISNALQGRDIKLAAQILWTTIKLIALESFEEVINKAIDMKASIVKAITETTIGVIAEGSNLYEGLQKVWNNIVSGAKEAWTNLKNDAIEAFNVVALGAAKATNRAIGLLDEEFDVDAADKFAEETFVKRQKESQKARDAELDAIEEARKAEIKRIKDTAKQRKADIESSLKTELDGINKKKEASKTGLQNEIDRLRAQQDRLNEQAAASAKAAAELSDQSEKLKKQSEDAQKVGPAQVGAAAGITSSFNIRALGADDINKKILKAGEDQVKELRNIKEILSGDALLGDNFSIA